MRRSNETKQRDVAQGRRAKFSHARRSFLGAVVERQV
jgi:hypothetical protein